MKKIIFIVLCSVLITGTFTNCGSKTKTDTTTTEAPAVKKGDAPKEKFVKLAAETNKDMPQVLPGGIRLDKVEALSKTEFKYYYTFIQDPVVSSEEFKRNAKLPLSLAIKESKDEIFDLFKKEKMTLIYAYNKKDGTLFAEVRLAPEDYTDK